MNLSHEDRLLAACSRQHFEASHIDFVTVLCEQHRLNWSGLYFTAQIHGVAPLVYHNLQKCSWDELPVPAEVAALFKQSLLQNVLQKERLGQNAQKAIEMFKAYELDVMVVKGGALDLLVYERPWFTVLKDIDFVLRAKWSSVSEQTRRTFMRTLHNTSIEYDYYTHHDITMNSILAVDFDRIWQDAVPARWGDESVFVMGAEDFLISVCINSCRKRYFRLKAMCDIAEIINGYPQLNWDSLMAKSQRYECEHIVYTALLATRASVGCKVPETVFDDLAKGSARKPLIRWLVNRSSLSAFEGLGGKTRIRGRVVNSSLLLPYATLKWGQIRKRVGFAWKTDVTGAAVTQAI